jgi:hypothetical protein
MRCAPLHGHVNLLYSIHFVAGGRLRIIFTSIDSNYLDSARTTDDMLTKWLTLLAAWQHPLRMPLLSGPCWVESQATYARVTVMSVGSTVSCWMLLLKSSGFHWCTHNAISADPTGSDNRSPSSRQCEQSISSCRSMRPTKQGLQVTLLPPRSADLQPPNSSRS